MSSADELARPKAEQCSAVIHLLLIAEAREDGDSEFAWGEAFSAALARKNVSDHVKKCAKCKKNWGVKA